MDTREKDIEKLKDYKYGFTTDIENIRAPKGLNEDVIKFISNIKKEPKWMLEFRLKALDLSHLSFLVYLSYFWELSNNINLDNQF